MSLTCPSVCRIAGENCQGFLSHHCSHLCYDDITVASFILQLMCLSVHVQACVCAHVCVWICDSERNRLAFYVIQCVKAPIPISMIISYSLWAKTATLIQFISPLLTGAEMLGLAEVTSEVFQSWRLAEFVLRVGGESDKYSVDDFGSHAFIIVCLPETRWSLSVHT